MTLNRSIRKGKGNKIVRENNSNNNNKIHENLKEGQKTSTSIVT